MRSYHHPILHKFDIEPGQTTWFDQTEEYKKAYFENQKRKRELLHYKIWGSEYKDSNNNQLGKIKA